MSNRSITIDGTKVRIIRTDVPVPMFQPFTGVQFLRKPCEYRKYVKAKIDGVTVGVLFVSVREAAKYIRKHY
jgi:hypothetical protein